MKKLILILILASCYFAGWSQGTTHWWPGTKSATPTKPKKPFSEMTAMEVAQNPAACGFKKGGSMSTSPVQGSDLEPSRDDQWTKETSDGKLYILTIHYDKNGKIVYAKWGGF